MKRQNVLNIRSGYPALFGANKIAEGLNFAAEVPKGAKASLILYARVPGFPGGKSLFRRNPEQEKSAL